MTELPNIFENAKVGDDVLCIRRGWLVIGIIHRESNYPINAGYSSYMLDGRYLECDKAPSLWPADKVPQYYLDLFPRPKKKVRKTIESFAIVLSDGDTAAFSSSEDLAEKIAEYTEGVVVKMAGEYEGEE